MPHRRPTPPLSLLLALPLVALACAGPAPEPAPPEPIRVESPTLGLAIAALPQPFQVAENDGGPLVLEAPGGGRLVVSVGPEERAGINLIEQVKARKAELEAAPGGVYFGNRELMTPIGTAFTARGAHERDGARVEETWIYAIHPSANRLLTLTYGYPEGESETRVQELVAVLGEVEGIGFRAEGVEGADQEE